MGEVIGSITIMGYVALWIMLGPICAVLLNYLGEKRWGNGPTWAWLGLLFNIFAVLLFLLLAGYETSEARSIGAMETKRVRQVVRATSSFHSFERKLVDNPEVEVAPEIERDEKVEQLLADHLPAEALTYAKERRAVAFQLGDHGRESLYQRYIDEIEQEDSARRARLAQIMTGSQG
jgi:hypothetical protein